MVFYIEYRGRKLYFKGNGNFYYPSYDKNGALEEVPDGYKVAYNKKGIPYMKKIR